MLDQVTVVDVEHGGLRPAQRVVIVGNRIQAVGDAGTIRAPKEARVIDARGKYLIPGLWDMHVHLLYDGAMEIIYPLFTAYGITGIRDAGSSPPLDTLRQWRREILAGRRVGPPRQILNGPYFDSGSCDKAFTVCADDTAGVRRLVDSLKAAGADMIKLHEIDIESYYAAAAEARRIGIQFGGHLSGASIQAGISYVSASDSGASLIDHFPQWGTEVFGMPPIFKCWGADTTIDLEHCRPIVERLRRNGTWWVPTLFVYGRSSFLGPRGLPVYQGFITQISRFLGDSTVPGVSVPTQDTPSARVGGVGYGDAVERLGIPILPGTDVGAVDFRKVFPGLSLHGELALFAAEGLTPLRVLQSATLEPAKLRHATDSLGTVAAGKLADLVLLDADPLADIANTTKIRAVVANGRFFDRTALDQLAADAKAKIQEAEARAKAEREAEAKAMAQEEEEANKQQKDEESKQAP